MNVYTLLPFVAFFTNFILGCFIIYVDPKNKINKLFGFVLFSAAIWSIGNYLTFTALTPEKALFWGKLGTLGATLTATFLLHFFLVFTKSKFISRKNNIILLYIPVFFFTFINLNTNMISYSAITIYWGYKLSKGLFYYIHSIYIVLYILGGFINCFRFYLGKANESEKIQAKFLIFAISIPLIGGILSEIILPFIGINFMPLSTTLTTIMGIIIAFVIVKYKLMTPFSLGIQRKLTASFLTIVILVSAVGLFSIIQTESLLYENIGSGSTLLASETMNKIDRTINSRIEEFQVFTAFSNIQESIKKSNDEFSLLGSEDEINEYIIEKDNEWISTPKDEFSIFMEELINNDLSEELRKKMNFYIEKYNYTLIGEIFITNKYGANVGQTGKTSDYYQADEIWWQNTVKNDMKVGNIEYDESASIYSLDITLRIDDEYGVFIGVLKVVWNIEEIINVLKSSIHSIGYEQYSTMNYNLLDNDGRLIYSSEKFEFLENKSSLLNYIQSLETVNTSFYSIISNERYYEKDKLVVISYSDGFEYNNIFRFFLVLEHDVEEIFASVTNLRNLMLTASILIIITGLTLGYIISRSISRPITKLRDATNKIGSGNLDIKIDVNSKDEVGELSSAFNQMTKELKVSKDQIDQYSTDLEKLLKQKDEFINQLGHDLKNPLGPIINLVPLLESKETDTDKIEILKIMKRNADYMKNLVIKTIELARLNSSTTEFNFEDTNLLNEIINVIDQNDFLFKEKKIEIQNNISKNLIVNADKLRLSELLNNMLNNSIKYSKDSSKITIDSFENDKYVTISIKDTGIGLKKEEINKIFNEFYKADESRHDFDSSGLGLSICKKIVEKHGGQIWIESEGIGKGSTFFFTLPKYNKNQEHIINIEKVNSKENKIRKSVNHEELVNNIDRLFKNH
jgi:signal transduction histidine kinase